MMGHARREKRVVIQLADVWSDASRPRSGGPRTSPMCSVTATACRTGTAAPGRKAAGTQRPGWGGGWRSRTARSQAPGVQALQAAQEDSLRRQSPAGSETLSRPVVDVGRGLGRTVARVGRRFAPVRPHQRGGGTAMTDNPEVSDLQMQIMQARYWKNTWRENLIRPRWADCPTTGWPSGWG